MSPRIVFALAICEIFCTSLPTKAAAPAVGYQKKVAVATETRIDWTFALANRSLATPPADWLPDYESSQQSYELFVPPNYSPKQTYPLVLFISPGDGPTGWSNWEKVCKQSGLLFASPYGAGNNCPTRKRVRIVLDVLDDIRRNYKIDSDRTYLGGFSGGGRIACALGFALPEYFGGVVPVCASGDLREESWLRHRAIDRVSVALVTGETDFNRGEVERLRGPMLLGVGVRAKVWTIPKMDHAMPASPQFQEVFQWLEQGLAKRRELAKKYPAMRMAGDASPDREALAKSLLNEGKKRLEAKTTLYSGLMLLQGIMTRWPDVDAAKEAKDILLDYEARKEKPWEAEDIAEQRKFLIAQARALDAYASGTLPQQYQAQRADMLKKAIELWQQVLQDGQDQKAVQDGKKRLPELQKLLEEKK